MLSMQFKGNKFTDTLTMNNQFVMEKLCDEG